MIYIKTILSQVFAELIIEHLIVEKNQEVNYTYPLHSAVCMRTPVTRWRVNDNRILCQLPDIFMDL